MKLFQEAVGWEWRKTFAFVPRRTELYEWVWLQPLEKKIYNCPADNVFPSSWVIYRKL